MPYSGTTQLVLRLWNTYLTDDSRSDGYFLFLPRILEHYAPERVQSSNGSLKGRLRVYSQYLKLKRSSAVCFHLRTSTEQVKYATIFHVVAVSIIRSSEWTSRLRLIAPPACDNLRVMWMRFPCFAVLACVSKRIQCYLCETGQIWRL